ncbi:MAG: hypothetical protein ACXAEU_01890 [Candidatus Hodarchaeales archaeon]|jgi:hypothetical protein
MKKKVSMKKKAKIIPPLVILITFTLSSLIIPVSALSGAQESPAEVDDMFYVRLFLFALILGGGAVFALIALISWIFYNFFHFVSPEPEEVTVED